MRDEHERFSVLLDPEANEFGVVDDDEELRHLVDAGLSPEQAWTTASSGPGVFPGSPASLGRVVPGAPADLLLLGEDPTRDLTALESLRAVVADGRRYDRKTLDAALATAHAHYRGALYDRVSMAIGERRRARVLREQREARRRDETPVRPSEESGL